MNLFKFFNNKSQLKESYFGLFLKEEEAIGFIFEANQNGFSISAREKFNYSNGWENITEDVDEILYKLENQTKKNLKKIIFFVYSHLIDQRSKEIKKPYINIIKDLVKNLELKPLGYIECIEGIATYLEKKEQSPLTAILIEFDKTNLGIFVYKGGNRAYSQTISRTDNLIDDLLLIFEKIRKEMLLPSRIVLYNSFDLGDESTKILSYKWKSDIFIQLPRVEIIKEEEVFHGLINVFQEQQNGSEEQKKFSEEKKEEVLGFVVGKDINFQKSVQDPIKLQNEAVIIDGEKKSPRDFSLKIIPGFKKILNNVYNLIKFDSIKVKFIWMVAIFLIALSFLLSEYYLHRAYLTVYLPTRILTKDLSYIGDINSSNKDNLRIYQASFSAELSQSKATTGKRNMGEKAGGEVTLYSFEDNEKFLSKGTMLELGGIRFLLNEDVKIASASLAVDGSAKLPGKNKAKVTAAEIGPEGNIDKGKRLKIDDLSSTIYFAINETAFSGGSKKEIRTVSKQDLEDLKNTVIDKVKKDNRIFNNEDLDKNNQIINELTEFKLVDSKFSKEVGEEGDRVDLKTKITAIYLYFKIDQLTNLLKSSLINDLPMDFDFQEGGFNYIISKAKKENTKISVGLKVKAKTIKKIPAGDLTKTLIGKDKKNIEKILKDDYGALSYELKIRPSWIIMENRLPIFSQNISLRFAGN